MVGTKGKDWVRSDTAITAHSAVNGIQYPCESVSDKKLSANQLFITGQKRKALGNHLFGPRFIEFDQFVDLFSISRIVA
jgi:hypothetical protein